MLDDDPERAVIGAELEGFTVTLRSAIESVKKRGISFGPFKRTLNRRAASIREEGYPELADSIEEDLITLEQELEEFTKLRSIGIPGYISTRIESVLQAREAKRRDVEEELRQVQAQSDRLRPVLTAKQKDQADLTHALEQQALEVTRLKKALKDAEDQHNLLEADLAGVVMTCAKLSDQVKAFDERAAALDHKIIHLLTMNEDSRALLEEELKQQYEDELAQLEERIRRRQLS